MYSYKEKKKIFTELSNRQYIKADLELLISVNPSYPQLSAFKRNPERRYDDILYALLDFTDRDTIRLNRRKFETKTDNPESLDQKDAESAQKELDEKNKRQESINEQQDETSSELESTQKELDEKTKELESVNDQIDDASSELESTQEELDEKTEELESVQEQLEATTSELESVKEVLEQEKKSKKAPSKSKKSKNTPE